MKLITTEIMKKLQKNYETENHEDVVLKLFDCCGAGTWCITQIEPDGDTMWGLCDLGMDCIEYGTVSLKEILSVRNKLGLGIERDLHYRGGKVSELSKRDHLAGC